MRFFRDVNLSAVTAGFVAVLVGFTSSVAIVFQAALVFGATPAQIASWMWALGLGMGLCSLVPSLVWRQPVMVAWSTPGAAVLATAGAAGGYTMHDAVGAFIVCAALITLFGVTGWFERVMRRIPMAIASALLAGVLTRFGLQAFVAAQTALGLVLLMLASYLLGRRFAPRYAVVLTLLAGVVFVVARGELLPTDIVAGIAVPVFVLPHFSWAAAVSLAVPLFIVTMASQNVAGIAVLRSFGYTPPLRPLLVATGAATVAGAPFGAHGINLAAITAALVAGPDAHPLPERRWVAGVVSGGGYLLLGLLAGVATALVASAPPLVIATVAGLALFGALTGALAGAMADATLRDAAVITLVVSASGISAFGISAPFWGLVAGIVFHAATREWRSVSPA